jgi:chaperone modulatory protein CbpM
MNILKPLQGEILSDDDLLSLEHLCHSCALPREHILLLVEEGIIEPQDASAAAGSEHWHFHWRSLSRVRTSVRLQQDLGVNLAGVGLALELLDRIAQLEHRLQQLPDA